LRPSTAGASPLRFTDGMSSDPGVLVALGAGLLSFLSPCVLPLVPGYLSAVSGVAVADLGRADWRRVLPPAMLFVATFSAIFIVLFGLPASALGELLRENRDVLNKIGGSLIVVMGVFFVAAPFVGRLNREWHLDALLARTGRGGPVVAGAAFAIAWTPCIGPTLSSILVLASTEGSALEGVLLLVVYSAGLGIPFLAAAVGFSRAAAVFDAVKRHYGLVVAAGGVILIAMGILIVSGEFFRLNIEAQNLTRDLGLDI
jgi:cytochrome c-type biogenesis protein